MLERARPWNREAFLAPFVSAGYAPVEPAILQPVELFLDLSGEELAKRLYFTTDAEGRELCLRPEMTIPVCLDHVRGGDPARAGAYCYHGPVFRHRPGAPGEFPQAGIELLGRADSTAAEAEILALALDCLARHGVARPRVRLGDTGLFRAVLDALELPAAWRRRLARDFGRADKVAADLASLERVKGSPASAYAGVLGALSPADRPGARALVEDLLRIGGLSAVGGRGVGEIADRFLEQAELAQGASVDPSRLAVLDNVRRIEGPTDAALAALRAATAPIASAVSAALDALEARQAAFAAAGIDVSLLTFDAGFGRRLDYYTGMVFEAHDPSRPALAQIIGGGRYDGLLRFLGASSPVPAVGFSVWIERLPGGAP